MNVLELQYQGDVRRDRFERYRQFAHHALARGLAARFQGLPLIPRPERGHLRRPARGLSGKNCFY